MGRTGESFPQVVRNGGVVPLGHPRTARAGPVGSRLVRTDALHPFRASLGADVPPARLNFRR
jgi:hypothetical protein